MPAPVVAPAGLTDLQDDYTYHLYACEDSTCARGAAYYLSTRA